MWKKDEPQSGTPAAADPPRGREEAPPRSTGSTQRASIGRSIRIKGEVSGDEDLLIQGAVEGSVSLGAHQVTVGGEGRVKASIRARLVIVEGRVEGDVTAEEQVVLRASARVEGDLTSPRVVIEDGARFRGSVDMGDAVEARTPERTRTSPASEKGGAKASAEAPKAAGSEESKEDKGSDTSGSGNRGSTKGDARKVVAR